MRGVLIFGGVLLATPAFAYDAPPPHSFAKPTANGKYVLVMLQPHDLPGDKGLKAKYGHSGLYPVGDSTKPMWTTEVWKADWDRNVFASDDGVFALRVQDLDPGLRRWLLGVDANRIPPKKAGWEDEPALTIYQNGKPFRTLAIREVFDTSRLTDRDCYMGPIIVIDSFQDAEGRVTISTEASGKKRTTTVAFRTGEVVEKKSEGGHLINIPFLNEDNATENAGEGKPKWAVVFLIGLVVVGACTAAFVALAAVLVMRQKRKVKGIFVGPAVPDAVASSGTAGPTKNKTKNSH